MPEPSFVAAVVLLVQEVSWTVASEEHQELPHEQDHEVVHWRESQVSAEDQFPNRGFIALLIYPLQYCEGPGKSGDPVEDIRLEV